MAQQWHIQPYLMHKRKCNALLRAAYTLNYIQRAGQPNIRARLMPAHNFAWTHTCWIMVLLGLLWQKWQQGPQLVFELDSVLCYHRTYLQQCRNTIFSLQNPAMYTIPQSNTVLHPWADKNMLPFTLSGLFIWQRRAGKCMSCKNYKLLYRPGPVSRGEAALQAMMDQCSCIMASGLHLLENSSVQLGAKASGRAHSYTFWVKCLLYPVQNMHAEGSDHFTLSLFHLARHSVKRTPVLS